MKAVVLSRHGGLERLKLVKDFPDPGRPAGTS